MAARPVTITSLDPAGVRKALDKAGFPSGSVRYGTTLYKLRYHTVDPHGRPTTASGLLVLPIGGTRHPRLVSFAHGTLSYRRDAPSQGNKYPGAPAVTFAASGYAAVAPDYLGLGEGPGGHPYMDLPSETTASLDMLRAARHVLLAHGRSPSRDVLVTGFSQGALAALGLARELQYGADPHFGLRAVAPVSGPYAIREAEVPAMLAEKQIPPKQVVAYTSYLLVAWNRLHHLYRSPADIFRAPYATRVDRLFDGDTPGNQMLAALPDDLEHLLTPQGFALLRHPNHPLAKAMAGSDAICSGWRPKAPIRLFYANNDEQVVNANTDRCTTAFNLRPVLLPPHLFQGSIHLGTEVTGTTAALSWFSSLT
ncbi:alpha/beta fold hydrolase [Actinomadura decatromicini]|uniref:Alpha/beta fold hydrolase n=1 Tax=Actinomadura decatromicini TaxID=2604572 RepID=A0A5D3G009_9ACTN|nr:alpha/beta fold hydrolase [Actinomadura decatromicini]